MAAERRYRCSWVVGLGGVPPGVPSAAEPARTAAPDETTATRSVHLTPMPLLYDAKLRGC